VADKVMSISDLGAATGRVFAGWHAQRPDAAQDRQRPEHGAT